MARFTLRGDQRHVDLDQPIDEAPSPPVAPAPPSTTAPEEAPPLIETPSPSTAPSFSGLGTTFNNATQAPVSSLSQTPVEEGGQGPGSVNNFTNDLTAVHNGLLAEVNKGQFSGAALGHVQAILSDINTAISTANATANSAGAFGSTAAAEQALRASHLDIINTVNRQDRCRTDQPRGNRLRRRRVPCLRNHGGQTRRTPISRRSARSSMTRPTRSSAASMTPTGPRSPTTSMP